MKSAVRILLPSILIILVLGLLTVMAAKPQEVIEKSNGFPSGPHSNLIIHGKDADVFICISPSPGGNSLFVPEYTVDLNGDKEGHVTIQYIQNKKASLTGLRVLDSCAMDDGLAKVQLPDKVMLDDGSTQPTDGFWVYAKIEGKPNHGDYCDPSTDCPSKIILYPNVVVEACNDPGNPDFGDLTDCPDDSELALGVITNNLYVPDPYTGEFVRFDTSDGEKGKGRSKAKDITRLFIYVGWIVDERVDISGDGTIDASDIPVDAWNIIVTAGYDPNVYDEDPIWGNDSGTIDLIEEWLLFQVDQEMAWYFSPEDNTFIHEIADLVITEQGLENNGTKNLQVRFYPRSTTVFH